MERKSGFRCSRLSVDALSDTNTLQVCDAHGASVHIPLCNPPPPPPACKQTAAAVNRDKTILTEHTYRAGVGCLLLSMSARTSVDRIFGSDMFWCDSADQRLCMISRPPEKRCVFLKGVGGGGHLETNRVTN